MLRIPATLVPLALLSASMAVGLLSGPAEAPPPATAASRAAAPASPSGPRPDASTPRGAGLHAPSARGVGLPVAAAGVEEGRAPSPGEARAAQAADTVRDLRAVLDTGWIVQDRNGDGVLDFVDVRIVLPEAPDAAEATAAANVAARLGYETAATDLDLAVVESRLGRGPVEAPVVVVGARSRLAAQAGGGAAALLDGLAPGQGALVYLPSGLALGAGGVGVVGYDASGLAAAAGYLSGRYPAVWDPDEDPWRAVPEKVLAFLDARGIRPLVTRLDRIVVDGARPGVTAARLMVQVGDLDAFRRATLALTGRDTAQAGGADRGSAGGAAAGPGGAAGTAAAPTDTASSPPGLATLHVRDLHRLDIRVVGPDSARTLPIRPPDAWSTAEGRPWTPPDDPSFSLADVYAAGGLYRDTNQDLVPDETLAWLSVAAGAGAAPGAEDPDEDVAEAFAGGLADLATRIGLETAGARLPLARVTGQDDAPEREGYPVVVGAGHYQLRSLLERGQLPGASLRPGQGFVRVVDGAFNGRNGMVVAGGDDEGTTAALSWLARRAPYLWTHGKGEYRLADAETEVRRFLQARKAPGQVALALHKLGTWMDRLEGRDVARVEVELAAEEAPPALAALAEAVVRERFPDAEVAARTFTTGFGVGDTIYRRTLDLPWEVDDARRLLESEVYPRLGGGTPVEIELRVSEPPEVRAALEDEIRGELGKRGVGTAEVTVLSAYKQGYSWLTDEVLPRLRGQPVDRIRITYHTLEDSDEVRWQQVEAPNRWLQELYPADAVLARELGIPDSAVTFHATRRSEPVYSVEVLDTAGAVLLSGAFHPRYVVRPFFDHFPEYEQIRVTTGWLTAAAGADTLVDARVVTDPERFWDVVQDEVYGRIIEYVMDLQEGRPSPAHAPYFDELDVRLRLSEPNHRIGIDEEVVSSLEALHEDLYFETLTLFDLIGDRYGVGPLDYPGRILPWIDPGGTGQPGKATITLTGKERGVPELVVRTTERGSEPVLQRYGLTPLPVPEPPLQGVTVRAGEDGLDRLLFRVEAVDSLNRWEEMRERTSEEGLDRTLLSVELLEGMLASLRRLHGAGLFTDALAWDRVRETAFLFRVEDDSTFHRLAVVPRTRSPASTEAPRLLARGWRWEGEPLVQWETPIPPAQNDSVLAKLATFPGVDVYYMTRSFLGQPVWVADFLPPHEAAYVSQAKLNALKPTIYISGRQHANEVSSTSHILRLAELLATDSTYRSYLQDVNVVLHPITNPDGARLAVQMQETNPDFMLHAGYLGALGVDATSGERDDDPVYPESQVRRRIRETWLPDVYMNMHGYPSHEWVQLFAGYSAWVRSRQGGQRDWWAPRGWFVPGFRWVDDDEHPEYTTAQLALLDSVAASITGTPDVEAMNRRLYARYAKYGREDREGFREHFRSGILVYQSIRGQEEIGTGVYSPRITWFATTTEAPDETARGEWLRLVASAGLAHSSALVRYLAEGEFTVEREAEAYDDLVMRKVWRVKPVLPPGDGASGSGNGGPR